MEGCFSSMAAMEYHLLGSARERIAESQAAGFTINRNSQKTHVAQHLEWELFTMVFTRSVDRADGTGRFAPGPPLISVAFCVLRCS